MYMLESAIRDRIRLSVSINCKFVNFCEGLTFMKIKSSQNAEIALLFTDICKSCPSHEFLASQICLLTLFVKIKLS